MEQETYVEAVLSPADRQEGEAIGRYPIAGIEKTSHDGTTYLLIGLGKDSHIAISNRVLTRLNDVMNKDTEE